MGVSCRPSGRGALRVWWSPPAGGDCAGDPVLGYRVVATPTQRTEDGEGQADVDSDVYSRHIVNE